MSWPAITAVPNRVEAAEFVRASLMLENLWPVEVVVHTGEVGYKGMIENERRAFEMMLGQDSDWCLLLHEDVVPAEKVQEKVLDRISALSTLAPDAKVISFFVPGGVNDGSRKSESGWLTRKGKDFGWEQALCMSSEIAQKFVEFSWRHSWKEKHSDNVIAKFLKEEQETVYYPVPGLFDHRLDIGSTVGHGWQMFGRPRNSPSFEENMS